MKILQYIYDMKCLFCCTSKRVLPAITCDNSIIKIKASEDETTVRINRRRLSETSAERRDRTLYNDLAIENLHKQLLLKE